MKLPDGFKRTPPSFMDKTIIFLGRSTIVDCFELNKRAKIFSCTKRGEKIVYLKFSYAGNVQYHAVPNEYIAKLAEVLQFIDSSTANQEN